MAGASSLASGLVSGLTGNVNKAYILVHKPQTTSMDNINAKALGGITGLSSGMAAIQGAMTATNNLGISSLFGVDKEIIMASATVGYMPVRVQFNPSTISFTGQGGKIKRESVGGVGENVFQQVDMPSETVMRVELFFDDFNIMDAFMMDTLDVASVGGVYQKTKQLVSAGMGNKFSVRDISELFVAAMVQSYTRLIGFVWNKMTFWGELTGVNLQFTMFNKQGEPIRSRVTLQIRQDQVVESSGAVNPYATESQWIKAFDAMFSASTGNGLLGNNNFASNLINI